MLCPHCGAANPDSAGFCTSCRRTIQPGEGLPGAPVPGAAVGWPETSFDRQPAAGPVYTYAAFWPRFGGWLLDQLFSLLIAAIPAVLLAIVLAVAVSLSQGDAGNFAEESSQQDDVGAAAVVGFLVGYVPAYVAYHTIAVAKGGGWGMRIAGLRVLRERDGEAPGYGTGFLRVVITLLIGSINLVFLLDHLWCIWDRQKQTWHDKIAGTVVVALQAR